MVRGPLVVGMVVMCSLLAGCEDDTVHAATSCPIAACGGDVVGEWTLIGACILEEDCASESGTITGTFTFGLDSYSYDYLIQTAGCGFRGDSSSSGGGSYRVEGNFLYRGTTDEQIFEHCVTGDVLELHDLDEFGGGSLQLQRVSE